MSHTLPGALEKSVVPLLDRLSESVAMQVSVLSERVASGVGSSPPAGDEGDMGSIEQTVDNMLEEFNDRVQAVEAQLALLGQKLYCATSATSRLQSRSPGPRARASNSA
eukprot:8424077-Pyramimonas_sp.AAC.1